MPDITPTPYQYHLLLCSVPDLDTLAALFMPFAREGGLFIPGCTDFTLGDEILLVVRLPAEPEAEAERVAVCGKVMLLSPGGQEGRTLGTGVAFAGSDNRVRTRIGQLLAGREPGKDFSGSACW